VHDATGVFAGLAAAQGLVDAEEHETYQMLFNILHAVLPKPRSTDLLARLAAPLLARVQRRGRPFEQEMPLGHLEDLQRHYDTWAARYRDAPVLRLDTEVLDFRPPGRAG
jgi:deoxyadenosine/deoxycytidine kinase